MNAFLVAALTRVMRAAVPISAVPSASVLHSATVGGSGVGVVAPLGIWGALQLRTGCLSILMFLTPLAEVTP